MAKASLYLVRLSYDERNGRKRRIVDYIVVATSEARALAIIHKAELSWAEHNIKTGEWRKVAWHAEPYGSPYVTWRTFLQ